MQKSIIRYLLIVFSCCLLQVAHAQCIIEQLADDLMDPKTSQPFKDFIKGNDEGMMAYRKLFNSPYLRKDVDVLRATANFLTRHADYLQRFPGKFDNILNNLKRAGARCNTCPAGGNKGIPSMHVVIDDMDWAWATFKEGNVDIQKLFTEMAANHLKADGGAYMLNVLKTKAAQDPGNFVKSITKFEFKYLDDGRFEADLARSIDGEVYLSEYKSWKSNTWATFSYTDKYVDQFASMVKKGEKFEYIANVTKLADEANPLEYVKQQFLKVFQEKAKQVFDPNSLFFKNINYNGNIINITTYKQLEYYAGKSDFINSSLFNFVKVL